MNVFARAVISGFGFTLGAAIFKRVSKRLGLEDAEDKSESDPAAAASDAPADGESSSR